MNVLFLTTSFPRWPDDYAGAFVFHLARHLRAAGVDIHVLAPNDGTLAADEVRSGVVIHRFNFFLNTNRGFLAGGGGLPERLKKKKNLYAILPFFLFSLLKNALRESRQADLVHCQWLPLGFLGLVIRLVRKRRFLVTVRGSDKVFFEKKFRWLAKSIIAESEAVVFVGRALLEQVPPQKKFSFIPNGVDVTSTTADPLDVREKIILYAGNLSRNKSVETLVRAVSRLAHLEDVIVSIVGDGPEKENLVALVGDLRLENHVRFFAPLPQPELFSLMARSYAFVLPSLSEGRSNVLLEALASGLAVVASRISANAELIEDGRSGFLFEPKNVEDLRIKIQRLLDEPGLRARLGEEGKDVIRRHGLTWENTSRQYLALYRKILLLEET